MMRPAAMRTIDSFYVGERRRGRHERAKLEVIPVPRRQRQRERMLGGVNLRDRGIALLAIIQARCGGAALCQRLPPIIARRGVRISITHGPINASLDVLPVTS